MRFSSSLLSFKAVRSCSLWLPKKCYRAQPYTALKQSPKGTTLAQPLASPIHPLQTSNIFGNFGNQSEKDVFAIFILSLYIIIYQYIIKREKGIIKGGKVVSKNGFQKFPPMGLWKLWKPSDIVFTLYIVPFKVAIKKEKSIFLFSFVNISIFSNKSSFIKGVKFRI